MTTTVDRHPEQISVGVDGSIASPAAARGVVRALATTPQGPAPPEHRISARSIRHGAIAAAAMALFYVIVVRAASGSWSHLADQARQDWYYLVAIVAGFGTQIALASELRHRHRLGRSAAATGGVGAGASTAGMIACCAHHLADLFPLVGAASAAGFVTDYRVPFMLTGIVINAVAVIVAARRLAQTTCHRHGALT
jgi:hypothetical protein